MTDIYQQGRGIMSTALLQNSAISECERLLSTSNQLYRSMLQTLTTLSRSPEAATAQQLHVRLQQFTELQQSIELHDARLPEVLNGTLPLNRSTEKLLEERRELVEQVLLQNRKVTLQAQAIHALLADEIRVSSKGYAALKGYSQPEQRQHSGGSFRRSM